MSCGGGSSGPSHTTVEQTTTNLPEWAEPYYKDLLTRTGYATAQPYQTYTGQRLAYFSPMEQEAMYRMGQLGVSGTPEELNAAGRTAYDLTGAWDSGIGTGPIEMNYAPGAPPPGGGNVSYTPQSRNSQYRANQLGTEGAYFANQRGVEFEPGTLADQEMLQRYMDPYFQSVVDVEKREAMRLGDQRNTETGLTAAGMGSLGGYREAIMRAENERNLMQQMGDIQTRGSQAAYQSAQQAFEADRAARAQLEQFQQSQFGMNEQFRQRQAELIQQGFSINEAARQAQEEMIQNQWGMNQQSAQFGAGLQMQQAQLQLQAYMAGEQAKQAAAQMGLDAKQIEQAGQIAAANARLMQDQNRASAAGMLGDFALQRQGMEIERLGLLGQTGAAERGMLQQGLDIGYSDWLRQQAYPIEMLQIYSNMLQGTPQQPGSTKSIYGQDPSSLQQMMGAGVAGLGLYNSYYGNQGGQG